jgi:hypothetical protein
MVMFTARKFVNSAALLNKNSFVCKYFGEIPISENEGLFGLLFQITFV